MLRKIVPPAILFFLVLVFFYDIVFFGKTLSTSSLVPGTAVNGPYGFPGDRPDTGFSFDLTGNAWVNEPNPYIIKRIIREHSAPVWNPFEGLGMPVVGNLNTEIFNPAKAFLNLNPSPFLQDLFFLLRLFVMGLFTYLFLREMKFAQIPAVFGGSLFMFSGYTVWWINLHPLSTIMYLPAVFYFYERWSVRKDRKSPVFMALFFCFSILGGKLSEIITCATLLFVFAVFKGFSAGGFKGLLKEGIKLSLVSAAGLLLGAAALLPFYELHSIASPIAKAIRTGASSHTLPLLSSLSLWQPLFLGKNYFYSSWFNYEPRSMLMYAGVTVLVLCIYSLLNCWHKKTVLPFAFFSILLFLQVYGLIPFQFVTHVPILRDVNYLKYNGMLYFSLSVISAGALDHLMSSRGSRLRFLVSLGIALFILFVYYYFLKESAAADVLPYLRKVFILTALGLMLIGAAYLFLRDKSGFGAVILTCMLLEFFLYMPRNHPTRYFPYGVSPALASMKQDDAYRIIGDGRSIPPLVSNATGFYDARGIDVLIPRDYYIFSENLVSFSVPYTNNPDPLIAGSSPFIDLLGVKHILSSEPLDYNLLDAKICANLASLRWIRLFDSMKEHNIKGGLTFGFLKAAGEERFSFIFPLRFRFTMTELVREPFFFAGLLLKDASKGASSNIRISIGDQEKNFLIKEGDGWLDQWIDVSQFAGKKVRIVVEGSGTGEGSIALGDFGFSPGKEREEFLCRNLLALHKKEIGSLQYKGQIDGLYDYENMNVMDRAFILHDVKLVNGFDDVVRRLQEGVDFRKSALISDASPETARKMSVLLSERKDGNSVGRRNEKVRIIRYEPDKVVVDVQSDGGLLVLSDLFYPGWRVKVDGREEEIVKTFGLLRGVLVGEGRKEVVFYYRPTSLYAGIAVSFATLIIAAVYLLVPSRSRK